MLVPIFLVIALPCIIGPVSLMKLYQEEIQWQKCQIQLDNTAILFGRSVRAFLNGVVTAERELSLLHQKYHLLQGCSAFPQTALQCRALAASLKGAILLKVRKTELQAFISWKSSKANAKRNIEQGGPDLELSFAHGWGISKRRCSICQLPKKWDVFPSEFRGEFWDSRDTRRSVAVSAEKNPQKERWNYRLWASIMPTQKARSQ